MSAAASKQNQKRPKRVARIDQNDFRGESRRDAKKLEGRANALSTGVKAYLQYRTRKIVRDLTQELRRTGKVRKSVPVQKATREEKRFARLMAFYGLRQITDTGREYVGSEWVIPNTYISDYLNEKTILLQQLDSSIEKEFREAVGRALAEWMKETPRPTIGQISERLRRWLTVSNQKDAPTELKPLGNRFTIEGLGARARTIARTEINAARNYGRVEAGKLLGREFKVWLASNDGKSGNRHHEALNGQIVGMNEWFENPKTKAKLRYPGDPKARSKLGVASEVINCRCSVRPITRQMAAMLERDGLLLGGDE